MNTEIAWRTRKGLVAHHLEVPAEAAALAAEAVEDVGAVQVQAEAAAQVLEEEVETAVMMRDAASEKI